MKYILVVTMTFLVTVLSGCGGGDVVVSVTPPPSVSQTLSDAAFDGDIEIGAASTILRQGITQSVFVGIDPVTLSETRAFLDFSLAGIPGNAIINSATLDIVVDSIQPSSARVPILVDLVAFPQPLLVGDFSRAFLATTTIIPVIIQLDVGNHVTFDVTGLMKEAQFRSLSHFQVRLLRGSGGTASGLVEINDTTGINRGARAPQLTVTYF